MQPADRRVEAVQAFNFYIDGTGWREYRLSRSDLAGARRDFPISFGSCSLTEPVDDLRFPGLL
jgi:hypothetical protein